MDLQQATKYIQTNLLDFQLKQAFQDDDRDIDLDFIEPFLVFMSQQLNSVPFGAVVGNLVGSRQDKINSAVAFLEALGESKLIPMTQVNGNWLVKPISIDHKIAKVLGCSAKPIEVDVRKTFCGNTLHKPSPSRYDHLQSMNDVSFKVNRGFLEQHPNIPSNVPYIKTLPVILDTADKLHLNHRFDTRGRTYCASHVNYQGTEYEKCLLAFSKELKVTDKGRQNIQEYVKTLKDSEAFLKSVAEQALNSDKTGIFIGADASASGIQLMSVLRGCAKSAESVGLTAHNDFYTLADQKSQLAVPPGSEPRKVFKQCSMQHFYGGVKTPKALLGEENLPKFYETLKELAPGCQSLLEELQSIYHATPIFKWTLPDGFEVQQPVVNTQRVELALPNNPNVTFGYAYKSLIKRDRGLEMAANVVHSVDGFVARELIYRAKHGNEITAELIDSLQRAYDRCAPDTNSECFSFYRLMETQSTLGGWAFLGKDFLRKAIDYCTKYLHLPSFDVISIHDDFKCHPNFLHNVKGLYVDILADVADSTLIKDIVEEINPNISYKKAPAPELAKSIRDAFVNNTGQGLQ